jgi:CPA1 family monovalent cation:H+ antiporter
VIAVVVAGIVLGNYGSQGRHSATSTTMIVTFWDFVVFLINSAVFLLIGLEIELGLLVENLGPLLLALGAILVARAIVVYGLRLVINRRSPKLPLKWAHVMVWGGMRGAVSIALVLSLPQQIEYRGVLLALVFGCVLFTVIGQGLSIRPLLDRLGLTKPGDEQREFEEALARLVAVQASSDAIERMRADHLLSKPMADRLQHRFEERLQERSLDLFRMVAQDPSLAESNWRLMQREIGLAQKQALLRQLRRGAISEEVYAQFTGQIDELLQGSATVDWPLAVDLTEIEQDWVSPEGAGET